MKIGLAIFNADPKRGGAERYTADIAAALAARGHRVDLLAARFGESIVGVNSVRLGADRISRAGKYWAYLNSLDEHLAGDRYDILHAMLPVRRCDIYHPHAGMAKASLASHLSREHQAARTIAGVANRLNRKRAAYAQVEEAMLHAEPRPIVLCLSDYIKGSILRNYPDIEGQLVKLFNAVDLGKFEPGKFAGRREAVRGRFGIGGDDIVALMIAQHFERKGLPQVLEAVGGLKSLALRPSPLPSPRVPGEGVRSESGGRIVVLVVGKDDPARSRELAKSLGISDQFVFAGLTDSPGEFYAAADFFVLPTRHDSCSLVVLEALAMGVPVISTVFNGACEIMIDGVHGFVLPDPGDVGALVGAMGKMLDSRTRESMGDACLALQGNLSFQTHVDRLEEIYRQRIGS